MTSQNKQNRKKPGRKATTAPIAKAAGITTAAVRQKRAQGKADDQIIAEGAAKQAKRKTWDSEEYKALEMRKLEAEVNLKEMEEKRRRGELVDAAEAASCWNRIGEIMRDAFAALPARAALKVAGKSAREAQTILQGEVHAILSQLSTALVSEAA